MLRAAWCALTAGLGSQSRTSHSCNLIPRRRAHLMP